MKFIKRIMNTFIESTTNESEVKKPNVLQVKKFKEAEVLINELKKARNDSRVGGVFHSVKYYEKLKEVSCFIKNNEFGVEKPEHLHYNCIIEWYYANMNNLNDLI